MQPLRAAFLLATAVFAPNVAAQQAEKSLRIVDLHGTPYERGLQHGKELQREIGEMVRMFEADLPKVTGEQASTFVPRFLAATSYDAAVRRLTPGLLDEVRGIADGSGQSFATMFAYQLIDELWAQTRSLKQEKCTSLGLAKTGEQPTIVAQNLDIPTWMQTYPTLLRIHHCDSDLQSLVVTLPGLIGAMGMNNGKVAVAVNTILQLAPCRDGLPVAFVVRGILEQRDDAAAREFLLRVKHASGQAYTIGGAENVTCHEASAHQVTRFLPKTGAERVWHTNHPVANTDWNPDFVADLAKANQKPGAAPFVCSRFAAIEATLTQDAPVDVARCITMFVDRSQNVCNRGTYVCAVMMLGEVPELRISPGAPDTTPFQTVRFAAAR